MEIYSDSPALLDIVKSTYVQEISDAKQFLIQPQIYFRIRDRSLDAKIDRRRHAHRIYGRAKAISNRPIICPWPISACTQLSAFRTVTADIEVKDRKGQTALASADANIRFIKRQERKARKQGYRVQEKYALILFDFDRSDIKEQNKEIVDRIVARIKEIPTATVRIVGHTDTIGQEAYNLDLSTRRAKAAYDQILAGGVPAGDNITYEGIGPHDALFDNDLPEGRALNRTVTVTLEYEQK